MENRSIKFIDPTLLFPLYLKYPIFLIIGAKPTMQMKLFDAAPIVSATTYSTLIADPAWLERGGGKCKRGADRHYDLLSSDDNTLLCREWLSQYRCHNHMHFYLWVTNNFLVDGLKMMSDLGFRYVTNIVWVKPSIGLGQYFRGQHEICLFGVRGKGMEICTESKNIPSVIQAPKRIHSQKPQEFYDFVEKRSQGPYLYLYSRQSPREGWTMVGDQVGAL